MLIELMSLTVAGLAVIFSPYVSWKIAKTQIRAQVVSSNRQDWINKVRDIVAAFLRDSRSIVSAYHAKTYSIENTFEVFDRMLFATEQIELMLNSTEKEHAELIRLLNLIVELVRSDLSKIHNGNKPQKVKERNDAFRVVRPLTQEILKAEWNRIKRGD